MARYKSQYTGEEIDKAIGKTFTFDADDDGIVDTAKHSETSDNATKSDDTDKLGGHLPEHYATSESLTSGLAGKSNKAISSEFTLLASDWSSEGTYSFESSYPSATYDIFVYPSSSCTIEQYGAFGSAAIASDKDNNILTALGTVPTTDIPVIIRAVIK